MKSGLDILLAGPNRFLKGQRVGLIANPTTVTHRYEHAADLMHEDPQIDLVALFGPEHGIRADAQYMVDVGDAHDSRTGLVVHSLYGKDEASLSPTQEQLTKIDALVFDIQDVGTRYYTYAATMAFAMREAAKQSKRVIILDRPNPLDGVTIEGGGIDSGLESFVGLYPIPQRHGMTVGELAKLYNNAFGIGCELEVVACEGWERPSYGDEVDCPWVMPSPNMPTVDTAVVYPGMCLLEGTNVSEGRGTTRPFELFGAPFIDPYALREALIAMDLPGCALRPCAFTPTFDKYAGTLCHGLQIHVTDRQLFKPYRFGLAVCACLRSMYPQDFAWRTDNYEFREDVPAFDLLTGRSQVRSLIDSAADFGEIYTEACQGADVYHQHRGQALIY